MATIHHPAALRNRVPIARVLRRIFLGHARNEADEDDDDFVVAFKGVALEVSSGTGCHIDYFAPRFPGLTWQPTEYIVDSKVDVDSSFEGDTETRTLGAIDEVLKRHENVKEAVALDASLPWSAWPSAVTRYKGRHRLVYCCNVFHITPRDVGVGVLRGASEALEKDGSLVIYGPFKLDGKFTNESNRDFDASLRRTNASWGYWDTRDVKTEAKKYGLMCREIVDMPANNFVLHFTKTAGD